MQTVYSAKCFTVLSAIILFSASYGMAETNKQEAASAKNSFLKKAPSNPLSEEEISSIRKQLAQCWQPPRNVDSDNTPNVILHIKLSKKGNISNVNLAKEQERYKSDATFRAVADSTISAIKNCRIQGLPPEKYYVWKEMELAFDPYVPKKERED